MKSYRIKMLALVCTGAVTLAAAGCSLTDVFSGLLGNLIPTA